MGVASLHVREAQWEDNDQGASAGRPDLVEPDEGSTRGSPSERMVSLPVLFGQRHTPEIPAEILPSWAGEYAAAVADSTQTPPALAVMLTLATVASCVAKRFEVGFHGGYSEPLNLWTVTALPSAGGKTPVISAITAPLAEWEREAAQRLEPTLIETRLKLRLIEMKIRGLEQEALATLGSRQSEILQQKIVTLEYVAGELGKRLSPTRLWTGDSSPARLQMLLAENDERMALLTDEGGIFEMLAGRHSTGPSNIDVFLQAHAGRSVRIDRMGREVYLAAPALSMGIAVQPEILKRLGSGNNRHLRGNGMLARFLFSLPRSNVGQRDVHAYHPVDEAVTKRYREGIWRLLQVTPQLIDGCEIPRRLGLTPAARETWTDFAQGIENRMAGGADLYDIQDWAGKLSGTALRIAGIFHLVEFGPDPTPQIDSAIMERAIALCLLLIEHTKAAFELANEGSQVIDDAEAIYAWAVEEKLAEFGKTALWARFKGRFTSKRERLNHALEELIARNIIQPMSKETTGRPATIYRINPAIGRGG